MPGSRPPREEAVLALPGAALAPMPGRFRGRERHVAGAGGVAAAAAEAAAAAAAVASATKGTQRAPPFWATWLVVNHDALFLDSKQPASHLTSKPNQPTHTQQTNNITKPSTARDVRPRPHRRRPGHQGQGHHRRAGRVDFAPGGVSDGSVSPSLLSCNSPPTYHPPFSLSDPGSPVVGTGMVVVLVVALAAPTPPPRGGAREKCRRREEPAAGRA